MGLPATPDDSEPAPEHVPPEESTDGGVAVGSEEPEPPPAEARSFLSVARFLELEGPPDWSARLDEYLYSSDEGPEPLN